jgi:hypothetical protein
MGSRFILAPTILAVVAATGCAVLPERAYPPVGPVSRVEVNGKSQFDTPPERVIDDPAEVARIVSFVDDRCQGWGGTSGRFGVPIPRVSVYFYDGERFVGSFGVGPGFFETHRAGGFSSRWATDREEREFLEVIGMSGYDLRAPR